MGPGRAKSELGDTGKAGDETCTRFSYVNNADPWLRGPGSREEKVAKACSASVSRPADLISDVKTYYDVYLYGSSDEGQVVGVEMWRWT